MQSQSQIPKHTKFQWVLLFFCKEQGSKTQLGLWQKFEIWQRSLPTSPKLADSGSLLIQSTEFRNKWVCNLVTMKTLRLRFIEFCFSIWVQQKISKHEFIKINGGQAKSGLLTSCNLSKDKIRKRIYWLHATSIRQRYC